MSLTELFPEEDYRFHMRFQRGTPKAFFAAAALHEAIISERRNWLRTDPETYSACLPECGALIDEAITSLQSWGVLADGDQRRLSGIQKSIHRCIALGETIEPDFLLLKADAAGQFRLLGGCVCFPSSWSLSEKVGRSLDFIHGIVPGLNLQIGKSIQSFLGKLAPEVAWLRHNWGLSRSPELNQHPKRGLPRLSDSVRLDEVWLRVEHQALVALPACQGVLFGIRIAVHSLAKVKSEPAAVERLIRALQTMPIEMAAYKNIEPARHTLLRLLSS